MSINQTNDIEQNVNGLYDTDSRLYYHHPDGGVTELVDVNYYGQPVPTTCGSPDSSDTCANLANRGVYFVSTDGSQLNFQADEPVRSAALSGGAATSITYYGLERKRHKYWL